MATDRHLDAGIFNESRHKLEERCQAEGIAVDSGLKVPGIRAKLCLSILKAPLDLEGQVCSVVDMTIDNMKNWARDRLGLSISSKRKADIVEEIICGLKDRHLNHSFEDDRQSLSRHSTATATAPGTVPPPRYARSKQATVEDCYSEYGDGPDARNARYVQNWKDTAESAVQEPAINVFSSLPANDNDGNTSHTNTAPSTPRALGLGQPGSHLPSGHLDDDLLTSSRPADFLRFVRQHTDAGTEFNDTDRRKSYTPEFTTWGGQVKKRRVSPTANSYNENKLKYDIANAVMAVLRKHPYGIYPEDEEYTRDLTQLQEQCGSLRAERDRLGNERDDLRSERDRLRSECDSLAQKVSSQEAVLQETKAAWEADKQAREKISNDVKTVKKLVSDFRGERQAQEKTLDTFLDNIDSALETYFNNSK